MLFLSSFPFLFVMISYKIQFQNIISELNTGHPGLIIFSERILLERQKVCFAAIFFSLVISFFFGISLRIN